MFLFRAANALFRSAVYGSFGAGVLRHALGYLVAQVLQYADRVLKPSHWIAIVGLLAAVAELLIVLVPQADSSRILGEWRWYIGAFVAVPLLGLPIYWCTSWAIKQVTKFYVAGLLGYLTLSEVPTAVQTASDLSAYSADRVTRRFFGSAPDWLVAIIGARSTGFIVDVEREVISLARSRLAGEPPDSPLRLSLRRLARSGSTAQWLNRNLPNVASDWTAQVIANAIDQRALVV